MKIFSYYYKELRKVLENLLQWHCGRSHLTYPQVGQPGQPVQELDHLLQEYSRVANQVGQ